jgi:hypothetical protein
MEVASESQADSKFARVRNIRQRTLGSSGSQILKEVKKVSKARGVRKGWIESKRSTITKRLTCTERRRTRINL